MGYRDITLSSEGEKLAESDEVKKILDSINNDYDYEPWVLVDRFTAFDEDIIKNVREFQKSESFALLDEEEQTESKSISQSVFNSQGNLFWKIENHQGEVVKNIQTMASDALLLSGITTDDICRDSPKALENYQNLGFKRRLDLANFIGACILAQKYNTRDTFVSFTAFESEGIKQTVSLGGSEHGDFRINQCEFFQEGSIDPAENKVMYAPTGAEIHLGAYHSVEPLILIALLKHIDCLGWSEEAQKAFIKKVFSNLKTKNDKADDNPFGGGSLFADYGTGDGTYQIFDLEMYYKEGIAQAQREKGDFIWAELPHYGSNVGLTFRTENEMFIIQYGKRQEGYVWTPVNNSKIEIEQRMLEDFLIALIGQAKAGYGRTSDKCLIEILEARLKMNWH